MARTTRSKTRTTSRSTAKPQTKKTNTRGAKGPKAVFNRSAEERNAGNSLYLRLDDNGKFVGYALFNPDPALEDNPGYVEFREHWDNTAGRFIPCWGEKNGCVFCRAGMSPSTRGLGAFLVTQIDGEDLEEPEIKLFKINWGSLQEWWDELDEEEATLGKKVRIKCTSRQDGDYITKFFEKDKLAAKDLKAAIKEVPDLEAEIQKNLDRGLEALRVQDILESDDDEDEDDDDIEDDEEEETKPTAKKKPAPKKKKVEEEDEEDDDEDEDEEDDDGDDEDEDEEEDDDDEDDDDEDEEDGDDEDDDEEEDDDEDEAEDDSNLEGTFTVVSTNESESTFTLKEIDSDLYFSPEVIDEVDFDAFKKGDKVAVTAEKDGDGDWVATAFKKAKATTTRKKK